MGLIVLTLAVAGVAYGAECPVRPPGAMFIQVLTGGCQGQNCPTGKGIAFLLLPLAPPIQYPQDNVYEIQPCDQVTWTFGDGATQTKTGFGSAQHTWTTPGNYRVTATITNALGTATFQRSVIAGPQVRIEWDSETVSETDGSASLSVRRTGDTSGRVSARLVTANHDPNNPAPLFGDGSYPVVFEPGETAKNVVVPLADNNLYDGTRQASVFLTDAAGGTSLRNGTLWVTDDEPRPTLHPESLDVDEGNGGRKRVTITVRLTGPLATPINVYGLLSEETAGYGSDFEEVRGSQISAGATSGTFEIDVIGDRVPELDEVLTFRAGPYGGFPSSPLIGPPAVITILNDDSDLAPHVHRGPVGERVLMTLSPGEVFAEQVTAQITTNNPEALAVPKTIVIPAGSLSVHFRVDLIGEGEGRVTVKVGSREFASQFTAEQRRTLVASRSSLALVPRGKGTFALSLSPPHDKPVTVLLTTDPGVLSVPASVVIPPGGEVVVEVEAIGRGPATIAAHAVEPDVADVAIAVDVSTTRRRAIR